MWQTGNKQGEMAIKREETSVKRMVIIGFLISELQGLKLFVEFAMLPELLPSLAFP